MENDTKRKERVNENAMKKTYHICLSAGKEIMFRDQKDYNRGFNCFALALHKTGSTGLVEAFMSTHCHLVVQTENPAELMFALRQPYALYFNRKYGRSGPLGERHHFEIEIIGLHHHLAAMSYVLRNPLHHGIAPIPFSYPNSSANAIFQKEMGKSSDFNLLPPQSIYKYIGRKVSCPPGYKMSSSGVFLRESVLDIVQVENMFVTPRSYNYYMSRYTSEDWETEQEKDGVNSSPITLSEIEKGGNLHSIETMRINERGRLDYRKLSDIEFCTQSDFLAQSRYGKQSVYQLSQKEKNELANHFWETYHLPASQIKRCLGIL